MAKIRMMSNNLKNKIAAGEVVERPSSVVKELVENSIDAKSTKIDIYLEESGILSIKIIDNGEGMDQEDALLAFERHATSKLLDEKDLFRIHSLGFRGEALPSIASVSDIHLKTSQGSEAGIYVNVRGGNLLKQELTHARKGCEITVNNLFFNTPARLKYLKTENTELSYITDFINKIAIAHPQIAFKLVNNNRVLLQTNGNNNIIQVLASIYGIEVAKKIKMFEYQDTYANLKLFFSDPEVNRTTRNYITTVINKRVIKNYELIKAVLAGYESYLPINRYPIVVIQLEVDPLLVDVNVHPAKLEVRLSNEEHIKSVITTKIRQEMKKLMYVPKVIMDRDFKNKSEEKQEQFDFLVKENTYDKKFESNNINIPSNRTTSTSLPFSEKVEKKTQEVEVVIEPIQKHVEEKVIRKLPKLYYIGQFAGTYLVCQNETGLYLIDQHAAQERINYEYYLNHFSQDINETYELLIPITFEFSLNEALLIEENISKIQVMNIVIEKFGLQSFIVTKTPNYFHRGNEKEILESVFDALIKNNKLDNKTLFKELAITLSCKRSIKANHFINELEVNQLLKDLENCDNPYTCPHGRPVVIHMTMNEIEHLFKRTM